MASYFFYGLWDYGFLSLIWISTAIDFLVAQKIANSERDPMRKGWLWLSMATNMGLLGVFKYYVFFVTEAVQLGSLAGISLPISLLHVALPVGISFYTFQTMSCTIDVYRRVVKPTTDVLDFALYVCYFPQLAAGPSDSMR